MARKRRKLIFCTECGKENTRFNKACEKCHKKIDIKDHLILDYLKERFVDDTKDNIISKILSFIKNFILNNLYGTVLIATIIFTSTSIVLNLTNNSTDYKVLKNKIQFSNLCKNTIPATLTCDDGYELVDGSCIKNIITDAKFDYNCEDSYYLKNKKCISDKSYNVLTKQECLKPSTLPSFMESWDQFLRVEETSDGLCGIYYCTGKDEDGNWDCSAGSGDEIPFTTVSYCESGKTLLDGSCKIIKNASKDYHCENGTLDNKSCIEEDIIEPIITCAQDYEYDKECNACKEV